MVVSIILKGLPKESENFASLVKYSKDEKTLEEIEQNLINFDNQNFKTKTESAFFSNESKCFNCQKTGHIAKISRVKKTFLEQTKAYSMKCVMCGEHGHIAKFCRKFLSQIRRTTQRIQEHTHFNSGTKFRRKRVLFLLSNFGKQSCK